MQQPRPPVIEINQKDMMDTLEELSGGASGAKSDGPDDNIPRGDCTEPLTAYCATQGHCGHRTDPFKSKFRFEYEPTSFLPKTSTTSPHHSNIHVC